MKPLQQAKVLEVIVTSLDEALEAEAGGADRLELVRALDLGGLTPDLNLVHGILEAVAIPVRVMVRENSSMAVSDEAELALLRSQAETFSRCGIDGLVLGWVHGEAVDLAPLKEVMAGAPACQVTFHRAIEHVSDPLGAIETLKQFPRIDRILTSGGPGSWPQRKCRLLAWRRAAAPEIEIIVGGGLSKAIVAELLAGEEFKEVHVGRAARTPHEYSGIVQRQQVALLKSPRG